MEQSILKSTKKMLGVGDDDPTFDLDIMTHINTAISTLTDLGVGPADGYVIDDETDDWDDFLPETDRVKLSQAKTIVYIRVKMLFDPPTSSYLLDAAEKQLRELEWRLSVNREAEAWVDPNPPVDPEPILLPGGQGE